MGPVDDLPESIFGRNCCALGVCVKQKQGLEVAPDALGDHIFPPGSNLLKKRQWMKQNQTCNHCVSWIGRDLINLHVKKFQDTQKLVQLFIILHD